MAYSHYAEQVARQAIYNSRNYWWLIASYYLQKYNFFSKQQAFIQHFKERKTQHFSPTKSNIKNQQSHNQQTTNTTPIVETDIC